MDVDFYNFPHGMMLDRVVGRDFVIGNNTARITRLLSESDKTWYNERWGVFEATPQGSQDTVILKMRFQLNPIYRNQTDLPIIEEEAEEKFDDECQALEECDSSGATPHLLSTQTALVQLILISIPVAIFA